MKVHHHDGAGSAKLKGSMEAKLDKNEHHYHKLSFVELAGLFKTSLERGLDQASAQHLLAKNGKNRIHSPHPNVILKLLGYLFTGFCPLIWIGAIICIIAWKPIGNPPDAANLGLGVLLIVVIFLQAMFSAFQDWSSGRVMKTIRKMMPSSANVIRDGVDHKIPVEELVVGDLVYLSYGTKVPADIRIIESHDLRFDRSMLTGESEPIDGTVDCTDESYYESKNMAFMATLITNGQGKGVVVEVGDRTVMGSIASLTNKTIEMKTSLHRELQRFVVIIAGAAIVTAAAVLIFWAAWVRERYPAYMDTSTIMVNTIAVLVAFIPEGLPVCVTLSLLVIAKRMAKSRVLVKNLATIETLSCVNVIASDKTGTLTQNKMFVGSACGGLEILDLAKMAAADGQGLSWTARQLIAVAGVCNNASYDDEDAACANSDLRKANGDATDVALLRFWYKSSACKDSSEQFEERFQIPFNSKNKWMMKLVRPRPGNGGEQENLFPTEASAGSSLMLLKGAPDILMKKCSHVVQPDRTRAPLSPALVAQLTAIQNNWCVLGQRVILLCYKRFDESETPVLSDKALEEHVHSRNDFTVVGMLGIIDPPREGISDVIEKCRTAGIRVFMVTGDYALTAAAIASQVGIFTNMEYDTVASLQSKLKSNHFVVETGAQKPTADDSAVFRKSSSLLLSGSDLKSLSKEEWKLITSYDEIVFSRTTPEQKLSIVKEFQAAGCVVGVTGDGVNDAPALKSADIGIAMGGGSDVAMEAAQLVLLDNNFASILIAIENGRLVFANLRKVILYLLPGGCMAELIPILVCVFLGVPQNLSSFQMIVISLFTDIAPSLSLMMEKSETRLLSQPPRSKHDHIVDWKFILHAYVFLGVLICIGSQFLFFLYMYVYGGLLPSDLFLDFGHWQAGFHGYTEAQLNELLHTGQTVTFTSLVIMQIFGNLLSTRTHVKSFFSRPPWGKATRNLWLFGAELTSIVILLAFTYIPFCNEVFYTRPIPAEFYFYPLVCCLVVFSADELRKLLARKQLLYFHKFGW